MRMVQILVLAVAFIVFSSSVAQAATVTAFSFSGFVTDVNESNLTTGAIVGDLVTGSGAYDTAALDQNGAPGTFFASFSSGSAFLTVNVHTNSGVLSFSTGPGTSGETIHLWNYDQSVFPSGDYFEFGGNNTSGLNMPAFTNGLYNQIDLNFLDGASPFDMVDGTTPPAAGLPDFSKVTDTASFVRGQDNDNPNMSYNIVFDVVPEPSSITILALYFGLAGWRRKRRRTISA